MGEKLTLSLKWGSHQETMLHSLEKSFDTQDFVDMTLACEGQSVQAHKVIVSACSSFLKKLLQDNPCPHPIIILKDVTMSDLKQLLEFMYCGQVTVEQRHLDSLIQAAHSLGIRGLADVECSEAMHCSADDRNILGERSGNSLKSSKTETTDQSGNSILASYLLHNSPPEANPLSLADLLSQPTTSNHSDSLTEDQDKSNPATDSMSETEVVIKEEKIDILESDLRHLEAVDEYNDVDDDLPYSKPVGKATALMVSLAKRVKNAAAHPYSTNNVQTLIFHDPKPCPLCGKIQRDEASLRVHMNNVHPNSQSNNVIATASGSVGVGGDSSAEHRLAFYEARPCSMCGKMYRDAASLRTHVNIMHTTWRDGFECSCKQVFQTKHEMYQHKRSHKKAGRAWP